MGIISLTLDVAGQVGDRPRRCKMVTTDNNATITAAGYLNAENLMGNTIYPTDIFDVIYSYNTTTQTGTYDSYTVTISNGVISLVQEVPEGIVTLPVTSGDFGVFDGTTGKIKDAGYSPTNAAKTKVVMANAATILNNLAKFADTSGTIADAGFAMKVVTGAVALGGSATQNFSDAFVTSASVVLGFWNTSANAVSIQKIVPGTSSFDVISSGDAGAGTFNYVVINLNP